MIKHGDVLLYWLEFKDFRDPIGFSYSCPQAFYSLKHSEWCFDLSCYECADFVNVPNENCPCNVLGCQEAIKRTWLALEEKGFI